MAKITIYGFTEVGECLCILSKSVDSDEVEQRQDGSLQYKDSGYLDGWWYHKFSDAKKSAANELKSRINALMFAKKQLSSLRLVDVESCDLTDEY